MTFDPDTLDGVLDIAGPARVAVTRAIGRSPQLRLETAGASTLILVCDDPDHEIPAQLDGITAAAADRTWGVVGLKRSNGRTVLIFQDDVVRALRADRGDLLSVPAGSTTVNELATRLTRARAVNVLLEPTRQTLTREVVRDDTTWSGLAVLAERTGRWRYSDGQQLVLASPAWLLTQPVAATVVENEDGYGPLDYDMHTNKALESAAASRVGPIPAMGTVHQLDVTGPAGGTWLVSSYAADLGVGSGRTTWHRPTTSALG